MLNPPPVPAELLKALDDHSVMLIIGHINPDGDAMGSQLALAGLLERRGKQVYLLSPGPFDRHEIQHLSDRFMTEFPELDQEADPLVIVVDCSTIDRIGPFASEISQYPTAVIDHHAAGAPFGDITYIHTKAFSVTYMIHQIYKALDEVPTPEEAQMLLFGLATDTGYFRHVIAGRGEVFRTVEELVEAGASPKLAYEQMYGSRPLGSRHLLGLLLARTEAYHGGRLLITWETKGEHEKFGEAMRDSESLYAHLLGTEGCEAVLYIREDQEDACTVGLRSKTSIDVSRIAASFGGGGHRRAAGFTYRGEREFITQELIKLFYTLFQQES